MKTYKTARLILRPYEPTDFDAVHAYSSDPENLTYMLWGSEHAGGDARVHRGRHSRGRIAASGGISLRGN